MAGSGGDTTFTGGAAGEVWAAYKGLPPLQALRGDFEAASRLPHGAVWLTESDEQLSLLVKQAQVSGRIELGRALVQRCRVGRPVPVLTISARTAAGVRVHADRRW